MRTATWIVIGLLGACGSPVDDGGRQSAEDGVATLPTSNGPDTGQTDTTAGGDATGSTSTAGSAGNEATAADGTTSGVLFDVGGGSTSETGGPMTYPVRMLPGLESITFYERTGGVAPDPFTFFVDGPELTIRLADPLAEGNFDIDGATGEFYDVYYSDEDGGFELDGRYLTISGMFGQPLPAGGGLNLAEIGLNFQDASTEFGNYVASFVILGDNAAQPDGNVENSIDGDLQTHTTMGNTVGASERLRVTLGFLSSSGPPPG
jgi:hypothetical protein